MKKTPQIYIGLDRQPKMIYLEEYWMGNGYYFFFFFLNFHQVQQSSAASHERGSRNLDDECTTQNIVPFFYIDW